MSKTGGGLVHGIPVNDTNNGGTGTGILYHAEDIGTGGGIVLIIYGGIVYRFEKGGIFGALIPAAIADFASCIFLISS